MSGSHPTFAEGSGAAFKDSSPVEIDAPDVVYSDEDDKAIDDYHRNVSKLHFLIHIECLVTKHEILKL